MNYNCPLLRHAASAKYLCKTTHYIRVLDGKKKKKKKQITEF